MVAGAKVVAEDLGHGLKSWGLGTVASTWPRSAHLGAVAMQRWLKVQTEEGAIDGGVVVSSFISF